jgi:hypothetical protein
MRGVTVMLNEHVPRGAPSPSLAGLIHCTVVVPRGKNDPEGGEQTGGFTPGQLTGAVAPG